MPRGGGVTQWLTPERFDNVVEFAVGPVAGKLVIEASLESLDAGGNGRTFRFRRGFFLVEAIWGGKVALPYPVPFGLLGDRAVGRLETVGYDPESGIRAAVGNKGTRFVFRRRAGDGPGNDVDAARGARDGPRSRDAGRGAGGEPRTPEPAGRHLPAAVRRQARVREACRGRLRPALGAPFSTSS